jgi:hypothetical protein
MQTNKPEALKLVAFLSEGLMYVDMWTPTHINKGGCGVFAKLLSEQLTKHGIPHKIYGLDLYEEGRDSQRQSDSYMNAMKNFIATNGNEDLDNAGVGHVVVAIEDDTLFLDSKGIINPIMNVTKEKVEIPYELLCAVITNESWNKTFDKKCIPIMEQKLEEVFSHMEDYTPGMFQYPKPGQVKMTKHTIEYESPLMALFS